MPENGDSEDTPLLPRGPAPPDPGGEAGGDDDDEVHLGGTVVQRLMMASHDRPRARLEGVAETSTRLILHMPNVSNPLHEVLSSRVVFNSLINMVYGNYSELSQELDPTEYFDYDDYPLVPVRQSWFEALPAPAADEERDRDLCVICLEPLGDQPCVELPECQHCFHRECVGQWFSQRNSCPVCRVRCTPASSDDELAMSASSSSEGEGEGEGEGEAERGRGAASPRGAVEPAYYEISRSQWLFPMPYRLIQAPSVPVTPVVEQYVDDDEVVDISGLFEDVD